MENQHPKNCKWSKAEDWAGLFTCYTCPKSSGHHCKTNECANCPHFTQKSSNESENK